MVILAASQLSPSLPATKLQKEDQATKKQSRPKRMANLFSADWTNARREATPGPDRKAIIQLTCLRLCVIMCAAIPARGLGCTVSLFIHTAALFWGDALQYKHRNVLQNIGLFSKHPQPFQSGFRYSLEEYKRGIYKKNTWGLLKGQRE